jgi:ubiquinone/menaquinone biosynthesis C-methylase UbiE
MNAAMGMKAIGEERKRCVGEARGRILEVGFGSGHNLPYYPATVEKVVAIDPSVVSAKLARRRIAAVSFPVEYLPLTGEDISAPDSSFDTIVSTFTLCSIPDVRKALEQMRRVLRADGTFLFVEHGRAPESNVQRWQDRLNPAQKFLFGGCHLNRDIETLIAGAGFEIVKLEKSYAEGPRPFSFFYRGIARR